MFCPYMNETNAVYECLRLNIARNHQFNFLPKNIRVIFITEYKEDVVVIKRNLDRRLCLYCMHCTHDQNAVVHFICFVSRIHMAINNYIINIRFVANIKLIIMSYILRIMIDALLTIH